MTDYYNISPIVVSIGATTSTAVKVQFNQAYTAFQTSMSFSWTIFDVDNTILYSDSGTIGEAILSGWGSDDDYIINAMATEAGLSVIWS
tara:strand:- start:5386 stop:5652 length:267 start_codon:yes stop_codon:yes gene_type:complete